jgi:hypothetical protein
MNMPDKFAGAVDCCTKPPWRATGLSDFGDRDYRVGLDEYLRAVDKDIRTLPPAAAK